MEIPLDIGSAAGGFFWISLINCINQLVQKYTRGGFCATEDLTDFRYAGITAELVIVT